jgi:hypothetical protein
MMPSHEEESLDGLELLATELEPAVPTQTAEGIRFRHRHFNGNDDSSSDEEDLGKGLKFPDPSVALAPEPQSAQTAPSLPAPLADLLTRAALESMASSVAQTLAGAVSSLAGTSQQQPPPPTQQQQRQTSSEDDDDDDFEIIDQGDFPTLS